MITSRAIRLCCLSLGVAAWVVVSAGCGTTATAQKTGSTTAAPAGANAAPANDFSVATVGSGRLTRALRIGGTTQAVRSNIVRLPRLRGQGHNLVLVTIVESGARVKKGDVLATFDATSEIQNALNAKASYDGLVHQVANQQAVNGANAAQRAAALKQAETALGTAQLELKKGPILSTVQAQTDQINVDAATAQIASLKQQDALQERADAAQLRILELQRDKEKVDWDRAQSNVDAMTMRAPIAGMVALVPVRRSDGMGPAQPGDQLFGGQTLFQIFDPSDMEVAATINEADDANLSAGLKGTMTLDAYPGVVLPVHFVAASPVAVASGGFGNPVRTFSATFHVDKADKVLLPDLSAAIDLKITSAAPELLVPRRAVHFQQQAPYVTVRSANGGWVQKPVTIGNFDDQQVEVLAGLKAGDQVQVPTTFVGEGEQ